MGNRKNNNFSFLKNDSFDFHQFKRDTVKELSEILFENIPKWNYSVKELLERDMDEIVLVSMKVNDECFVTAERIKKINLYKSYAWKPIVEEPAPFREPYFQDQYEN